MNRDIIAYSQKCKLWILDFVFTRNTHTFEGDTMLINELKFFFFQTLFEWTNVSGVVTFISLSDMLDFCIFTVV